MIFFVRSLRMADLFGGGRMKGILSDGSVGERSGGSVVVACVWSLVTGTEVSSANDEES